MTINSDVAEVTDIAGLPTVGPGGFFWEEPAQAAREVLAALPAGPLRVLTGPEGGLSEHEARGLEELGWRPAHLGPRILRADTAVVVATTLALHGLGEGGY